MQKIFLTITTWLLLSIVTLSAQVIFTPTSPNVDCAADTFCVDIRVSNFDSVLSMQFAVEWDESQLTYVESFTTLPNTVTIKEDSVANGLFWFNFLEQSFNVVNLPDETVIWKLCYEPINGGNSNIDLVSVPVAPFVFEVNGINNGMLGPLPFTANSGMTTVDDLIDPTITCPPDTTIFNPGPIVVGNIAPINVSDNCGVDTVYYELSAPTSGQGANDASGETFAVGTTTVNYNVEDGAGNPNVCSFDVTVADTTTATSDVLEFIPVVNYDCDNNTFSIDVIVVNYDSISSFAHAIRWDTLELQYDPPAVQGGAISVNLPQLTNNTVYATHTLFSPPFYASLPDSTVLYTLNFTPLTTPTSPYISFENLNNFQLILVNDNNGPLVQGVDYIFQNEILNVEDNTPPDFGATCLSDTTLYSPVDECQVVFNYIDPTATDACDSDLDYTKTHSSGENFPVGNTTVEYTATDDAGNVSTCSFVVTVLDTIPPDLTCPANQSFACPDDVAGLLPSFSEACGVSTIAYIVPGFPAGTDDASDVDFPYGTSTVTYIATDVNGNSSSCSFTVTVDDSTLPTITCPAPVIGSATGSDCSASAFVAAPTVSDQCAIAMTTYEINGNLDTLANGASGFTEDFIVGSTTVTFTTFGANGQSASCIVVVTITDDADPTLTCPADMMVNLTSGQTDTVLMNLGATANDNCGAPTVTYTLTGVPNTPGASTDDASGSTFTEGVTIVTYTAEDGNGNTATCSFTVTVDQASLLDISCPNDTTETTDEPNCSDEVFGIPVVINSDTNSIASITYTLTGATIGSDTLDASGVTFNVDTTIVTYFVTDIFGRDESCSFEVVIIDDDLPDMTCPTPDALPTDPNSCEATVPLAAILPTGIIDNCGIDSVTYEFTTGPLIGNGLVPSVPTVYPIGTTEITYRAYDVNGNVRVCDVFIVVNDTQGPTTDCPADVTINVPNGTVDTVLNGLGILNAADVCGDVVDTSFTTAPIIPTVGTLDISGTAFPVGETLVTYTTLDDSGNAGTCSFTVNVIEDPGSDLIDCPTDMDVCNPIVTAPPIYLVDPSTITLSYTTSTVAGGTGELTNVTLPTGPTVVTYTAVNSLNESDVCSFNINVDNEAPTFLDCPGGGLPLVFETAMGSCTASATWDIPTPTDNCGLESVTFTHVPPVDLAVGSHDIMYTATDTAGNVGTCSFTVIINDTEAPVWDNCPPADVVLTPTGNGCDAVATWTAPTATDACSVNIDYATNDDIMPGDTFATTTTVIYTATDESGNTAVCTFEIVVEDTQDPVPNCPDDITIDADPTICGYIAAWVLPTATDDCSNVGISCTHMPGDTIGIGQTIVVCTAIDAAGNDASCTFTVTVVDNSPPVIMDCPVSPITSNVTPDSCGAFVTWDMITAMDDCDTTLTITTNFDSGDYFPVGTTTVTYTATDDGNNAVTCSFDVIVEDDEAPVIDCPENVVIDASGNIIDDPSGILTSVSNNNTCDSVTVEFNSPTITDNCGTVNSSIIGITSGDTIAVGVYEITYTANDGNVNNESSCTFSITVLPFGGQIVIQASPNDTVCSGDITLSVIGGLPDATYEWTGPAGWTSSDPAPVLDPLSGNYTVVCTSATGCTSTADIDITFGNTPEIEASNDGPLCGEGDLQLTLTGASAGDVILWTAPNGETFDVQNPMLISPGEEYTGTWTVTVDNGICDATTTTEVIVGDLPNVTVNSDCNGSICLGETCTIIGQEVAGTTVTYNWSSNPEGCIPEGITSSTFDLTPTEAGECTIYYSISAGNCTSAVDSITISVSGAPVAIDDEYTIAPDETLVNVSVIENDEFNTDLEFDITLITPTENIPGRLGIDENGILNYDPEGFAGVASFVYELCVNCDTENCVTGIVNITVRDESCRVPTVITPNGDDKNEVLIINCLETEDFPESEMIIFNEWGDEVFYAQPYLNNWDGTLDGESGKDLPDGTYFYIFKLDNATDADKGHITIFR